MRIRNVKLVISDALLAGIVVLLTVFHLMDYCAPSEVYMFCICSMSAVYLLFRIVLTIAPRVTCYVLLVAVAVFCLKESYYGLMQILGHFHSNHYMYACTGSFNNPGPYGGFLAVCICVLGAYAIKGCSKVFRYITGITSLIALILLPSIMSRTAMLAVGCAALMLATSTDAGKRFLKKHRIWLIVAAALAVAGAYMLKKPSADGRLFMNRISHIVQFQVFLAVLLAVCATPRGEGTLVGSVLMVIALLISLLFLINRMTWMNRLKEATETWKKTEYWYNMEYYDYVVEDADTLYDSMRHDYRFLFSYGQSLSKEAEYIKSNEVLSEGSRISSDPMFWVVMGNNNISLERYEEAERCYVHAFHIVPNRLYPLCRLAELYIKMGDYDRFYDMKQKIDRFKSKIESPTTDMLRNRIAELADSITLINEHLK